MFYAVKGAKYQHSYSRISHYFSYFCLHIRSITMYGAYSASRFLLAIPALFQTLYGIISYLLTLWTQNFFVAMLTFTVDGYHLINNKFILIVHNINILLNEVLVVYIKPTYYVLLPNRLRLSLCIAKEYRVLSLSSLPPHGRTTHGEHRR